MNAHPTLPTQDDAESALLVRLREATALLEALAADRQLLDRLPADDRARLQLAVANVYHPDPVARRVKLKAAEKARHAA
jgi:hypothetical protein